MCQQVLVLLAVVAGYAGAAAIERCCSQKMVGGVNYTLVDDTTSTGKWGCHSDCIFERVDMKGSRVCFKSGDLEVVCPEDFWCDNCVEAPENVCDTCFEFCSPDPNNTACLDCVKTDCPICLRPCGFPPIDANATEDFPMSCRCTADAIDQACIVETNFCFERFGYFPVCFPKTTPDCGGCKCVHKYEGLDDDDAEGEDAECVVTNSKYLGNPSQPANKVGFYTACQSQCDQNRAICSYWSYDFNSTLCYMYQEKDSVQSAVGWNRGDITKTCPASA